MGDLLPILSKIAGSPATVYLALREFGATSGKAWPSWDTLQRVTGYSRATIHRAIAVLKEHGLSVPDGRVGRTIRYDLRVENRLTGETLTNPKYSTSGTSGTPAPFRGLPERPSVERLRGPRLGRYRAEDVAALAACVASLGPVKNQRFCQAACKRFISQGGTYEDFQRLCILAEGTPNASGKARDPTDTVGLVLHWMYARETWQEALSGQFSSARAEKFNKRFAPQLAVLRGVSPGIKGAGDVLAALGFGRMLT